MSLLSEYCVNVCFVTEETSPGLLFMKGKFCAVTFSLFHPRGQAFTGTSLCFLSRNQGWITASTDCHQTGKYMGTSKCIEIRLHG